MDETTAKLHRFGEILNTLLWGFFHQKRIQTLEEMAENPLLKSLSLVMRRPYSKEFITILKKK